MKKAIGIADQLPPLATAIQALDEMRQRLKEEQKFLDKQKKNLDERFEKEAEAIWVALHGSIKAMELFPRGFDYKKEHHHMVIKDDVLYVVMHKAGEDCEAASPLASLLGALFKGEER